MFDLNRIMGFGKIIMVKENESIFEEGSATTNLIYVVFSGRINLFSKQIRPNENLKISELTAGSIFGETSALTKKAYTFSAVAFEKTALIILTVQQFKEVCMSQPQFAISSIEGLSELMNRSYYKEFIKEKPVAQVEAKRDVKANKVVVSGENNEVFPFGIKLYNITEPETHKDYVYDYEATCPVCKKKLAVKTQLTARLALVETDFFLHKHYKNFEPVWYNIWTCPHCYYSNLYYDFEETPGLYNDVAFIEALSKIKKQVQLTFTYPKNVDEAISSYYIAIFCAHFYGAPFLKIAKLWLQLSWLYQEVKDEEMYRKAAEKALEYYCKMYYDSHETLEPVHEQACFIVMAELFILFGDLDRALTFLVNARKHEDGNRYYMLRAERRADDVRDMRKALKESEEQKKQ